MRCEFLNAGKNSEGNQARSDGERKAAKRKGSFQDGIG